MHTLNLQVERKGFREKYPLAIRDKANKVTVFFWKPKENTYGHISIAIGSKNFHVSAANDKENPGKIRLIDTYDEDMRVMGVSAADVTVDLYHLNIEKIIEAYAEIKANHSKTPLNWADLIWWRTTNQKGEPELKDSVNCAILAKTLLERGGIDPMLHLAENYSIARNYLIPLWALTITLTCLFIVYKSERSEHDNTLIDYIELLMLIPAMILYVGINSASSLRAFCMGGRCCYTTPKGYFNLCEQTKNRETKEDDLLLEVYKNREDAAQHHYYNVLWIAFFRLLLSPVMLTGLSGLGAHFIELAPMKTMQIMGIGNLLAGTAMNLPLLATEAYGSKQEASVDLQISMDAHRKSSRNAKKNFLLGCVYVYMQMIAALSLGEWMFAKIDNSRYGSDDVQLYFAAGIALLCMAPFVTAYGYSKYYRATPAAQYSSTASLTAEGYIPIENATSRRASFLTW